MKQSKATSISECQEKLAARIRGESHGGDLSKKGKNTTRTIPFLVKEVHGLSGFALANADPKKSNAK